MQLSSEKSWRGGEQQIAYLIQYLKTQNVDVVVCCRKNSAFSQWCREKQIRFYELGFKNGADLRTALGIKRIAKRENIDIINVHSGKSHSLAYLALRLGMNRPLVVHRRVDFPLKTGGFSLAKYNHKNVKQIICVSNAIALLVRKAVQNPDRVKTVYSGIDPTRFAATNSTGYIHNEFNINPSKRLIANISAIAPHKDYETFLRTAQFVIKKRNDCHFLIVGDGNLRHDIEDLAKSLQLSSSVTFTGFRNDIPQLFRELTLFLITSDTEGLGTTVIDSLCNGIPVVATNAGGIPELVRNGEEGYLCSIGDSICLGEKVNSLLSNEDERQKMSKKAIERAKLFTNEQMGEGVLRIYREIKGQSKS